MTITEALATLHPDWGQDRIAAEAGQIAAENKAGKAAPSAGNTGPRDFSEAVHVHFAKPPAAEVPGITHLEAHIYLSESERDKISASDLFEAITEFLQRHGIDPSRRFAEAHVSGEPVPPGVVNALGVLAREPL